MIYAIGGVIGGVVLFFVGFRYYKIKRLVENIPTSKIRSMALGLVETQGKAVDKNAFQAPLTKAKCVYYACEVDEWVRSGKNHTWKTILKKNTQNVPFLIKDETGVAQVVPHGASFSLSIKLSREATSNSLPADWEKFLLDNGVNPSSFLGSRRFKFKEYNIVPGQNVYVLGVCRDNRAFLEEAKQIAIREAVKETKGDTEKMSTFDTDGDGEISGPEWDQALSKIKQEVASYSTADDQEVFIGCGTGGRDEVFHISESEDSFHSECAFYAMGGILGGSSLSVGCLWYLLSHLGVG